MRITAIMLCVIIPTLNAANGLETLLPQLSGAYPFVGRVVVSDGGSEGATLEVALRHKARLVMGRASRGAQLRRGGKFTGSADWLLFIHSDSHLPDNWQAIVQQHMTSHTGKAAYFNLRFDSSSWKARVVESLVRLRCWAWALPYGDQGLLIPKSLYEELGGYQAFDLFEDVDMVERIGRERLRRLKGAITTSAAKYERDGFFSRGWRNFRLLRRYKRGASIEALKRDYM